MIDGINSASALRFLICQDTSGVPGNDLVTLSVAELPNGAFCYTTTSQTLYVLDKFSSLTADGILVVAASGGGRWIARSSASLALYSGVVALNVSDGTPSTGALTQNTWTALPSNANQYTTFGSMSIGWAVNTTTGVMTYSGPTRNFIIIGSATLAAEAGSPHMAFSFSQSNGTPIVGTTSASNFAGQFEPAGTESTNLNFAGVAATIVAGSTIQGVLRNVDGTEAITVQQYSIVLMAA